MLRKITFQAQKTKKIHPEEISYTSGNGNPDKVSYIFSKENFSYISENRNPEKILYVSGNGTFLCFRKLFIFLEAIFRDQEVKKPLIFQEVNC